VAGASEAAATTAAAQIDVSRFMDGFLLSQKDGGPLALADDEAIVVFML
jgi:hypothetical protein